MRFAILQSPTPRSAIVLAKLAPSSGLTSREGNIVFGRTDDEWDAIIDDAIRFLKDQARLRRLTSYTELNAALGQRGHRKFDFTHENERQAVGAVLSNVTQRTIGASQAMLSSIVVYIDRNDAGPGFYSLAVQLGLMANTATADDKLAFWSGQVGKVYDLYARPPRKARS